MTHIRASTDRAAWRTGRETGAGSQRFGGLLLVESHLAKTAGGHPFLGETDLLGDIAPLDAFLDLGGDDHFGDVVAVHDAFSIQWLMNCLRCGVDLSSGSGIQRPRKLARDRHVELLQHLRAQQNVTGLGVLLEQSARLFALVGRIGVEQLCEDVGVEEKLHR
jgi:hypothetical protein